MTDEPGTPAATIDGVDVDAVAAAVTACAGVSGLFGGRGEAIASYLPGRRVPGVEVSPHAVVITVRSRWNATAAELLEQISRAVSPELNGQRLEVVVADIDDEVVADVDDELTAPVPAAPALEVTAVPVDSPAPASMAPAPESTVPVTTAPMPTPPVPTAPMSTAPLPTAPLPTSPMSNAPMSTAPTASPVTMRVPGSSPTSSSVAPKPAPPRFPIA